MKAKRFLAKVLAVTMLFTAAGAVMPDSFEEDISVTASSEVSEPDEAAYSKLIEECRVISHINGTKAPE